MKKTDLKKIIKEEILKEFNSATKRRMDGLVMNKYLKQLQDAILGLYEDFRDEGFDDNDIKDYILDKINKYVK